MPAYFLKHHPNYLFKGQQDLATLNGKEMSSKEEKHYL